MNEERSIFNKDYLIEAIVQELVATDSAERHLAGRDWSAKRFSEAIVQGLVATGNAERHLAGRDWPDGRFSEKIAQALIAARDWPKPLHVTDEETKQSNEDVSASAAQAHNATGADAPRSAERDLPEQPDSAADESGDHKNQDQSSQNQLGPSL